MAMNDRSIPAHFDGEHIRLDAPIILEPNAKLIVTILPKIDVERDAWVQLSQQGLGEAYAADEPDYSLDSIKEANPEYEGG